MKTREIDTRYRYMKTRKIGTRRHERKVHEDERDRYKV